MKSVVPSKMCIRDRIRSDRMDEVAEKGFAAHWKYKEGNEGEYTEDENELNDWLSTIKEILDDPQPDAMDFLDAIKLNLYDVCGASYDYGEPNFLDITTRAGKQLMWIGCSLGIGFVILMLEDLSLIHI